MRRFLVAAVLALGCSKGSSSSPDAGGQPGQADAADPADARPRPDAAPGIHFTFDSDLEGWIAEHQGGEYDRAMFLPDEGNPGGCVLLDGSDLGTPNATPNSSLSREIELPLDATTMKFETRAQENGALRVRLLDGGGIEYTLLDFEVVSGPTWVSRTADLTGFGGEAVTIVFEQNDNDVGQGEMRYIDNVAID
jgi:hypothetical protein